ncbi:unnamed protein product [Lasius platythorax]|uniref:Uncharacterized protein n=1 Tax=Lasius platythorax TaxID=488582 RepID=A0AAV2PBW5_9HYME
MVTFRLNLATRLIKSSRDARGKSISVFYQITCNHPCILRFFLILDEDRHCIPVNNPFFILSLVILSAIAFERFFIYTELQWHSKDFLFTVVYIERRKHLCRMEKCDLIKSLYILSIITNLIAIPTRPVSDAILACGTEAHSAGTKT